MNVLRQLKVIKMFKDLAESKFNQDVFVKQYGFSIIISPRDAEELQEIIKELVERDKERLVIEWEKKEREKEKERLRREKEKEREFERE